MEILINNDKGVEALEYYGDLMTKYKVVVPDAITGSSTKSSPAARTIVTR